jgi:opacity protein-like surface antigen
MKMRSGSRLALSVVALTAVSVGVTVSASAQGGGFGTRPTAGIFGGVTSPKGDFKDEVGIGWNVGALAKMRIFKAMDVRLDGTYAKLGKKNIEGTDASVATDAKIIFGTLDLLVNMGPDSAAYPGDNSITPYILGGFGMYNFDYAAVCTGACGTFDEPEVKNHFGMNIGGGASIPLAGIRTFVEIRVHRMSRDPNDGGSRTMLIGSAGVKFR